MFKFTHYFRAALLEKKKKTDLFEFAVIVSAKLQVHYSLMRRHMFFISALNTGITLQSGKY